MSMVKIERLSKFFYEGGQQRQVLDQVDAAIHEGQFVALLGRSGSGKSTLLNLISGIEKPDGGDVTIRDVTITRLRERERTLFRRDHIGFVFQFFNLIPTLTVLENVTLPQELAGKKATAVSSHALHLLDQVGLADRRDAFPDKLSGGEQQRVAIARALVHEPRLLLADEPTGNLDDYTGEQVGELLFQLTEQAGTTFVLVTHDQELAGRCHRVMHLHEGHLAERQPAPDAAPRAGRAG